MNSVGERDKIDSTPIMPYYKAVTGFQIIIRVKGNGNLANSEGDYFEFTNELDEPLNIANGSFLFMKGKSYRFENHGVGDGVFKIQVENEELVLGGFNDKANNGFHSITVDVPVTGSDPTVQPVIKYYSDNNPTKVNFQYLSKEVKINDDAGHPNDGWYDFYYGDIEFEIDIKENTLTYYSENPDDKLNFSFYCFSHGYMGAENILEWNLYVPNGTFDITKYRSDLGLQKVQALAQSTIGDTTPYSIFTKYFESSTSLVSDYLNTSVKSNPRPNIDFSIEYEITSDSNLGGSDKRKELIEDLTVLHAVGLEIQRGRIRITLFENPLKVLIEIIDNDVFLYLRNKSINALRNEYINLVNNAVSDAIKETTSTLEKTRLREVYFDIYFSGEQLRIIDELISNTYQPTDEAVLNSSSVTTDTILPEWIINQLEDQFINNVNPDKNVRDYAGFDRDEDNDRDALSEAQRNYLYQVEYDISSQDNNRDKRLIIIRLRYESYVISGVALNLTRRESDDTILVEGIIKYLEDYVAYDETDTNSKEPKFNFRPYYDDFYYVLAYIGAVKQDIDHVKNDLSLSDHVRSQNLRKIILMIRFGTYKPVTPYSVEESLATVIDLDGDKYERLVERNDGSLENDTVTEILSDDVKINSMDDVIEFYLIVNEKLERYHAIIDSNNYIMTTNLSDASETQSNNVLLIGKIKEIAGQKHLDLVDDIDVKTYPEIFYDFNMRTKDAFSLYDSSGSWTGENLYDKLSIQGADILENPSSFVNEDSGIRRVTGVVEKDKRYLDDPTTLTNLNVDILNSFVSDSNGYVLADNAVSNFEAVISSVNSNLNVYEKEVATKLNRRVAIKQIFTQLSTSSLSSTANVAINSFQVNRNKLGYPTDDYRIYKEKGYDIKTR